MVVFFFQAEDGIRDLVRSRGLGDVYKRQVQHGRDRMAVHRRRRPERLGCRQSDARRRQIAEWLSLIHI